MTLPAQPVAPGSRLQEFEIDRVLGAGGFGITYLARDAALDRFVAIKEYFPRTWAVRHVNGSVGPTSSVDVENYQWGLEKFIGEARALARLDHPQIVRVHRVIEAMGTAYLVMDYVEGRSLAERLSAGGPMPEARVRQMLVSLAEGLAAVHAAGLLHRDIKPTNVMVRRDETPVLIDFGAAQLQMGDRSRSLKTVLTPGYAPIEQYASTGYAGREGPWTDIYALGAVGYAALTGRVPVDAIQRVSAPSDTLPPVATSQPVSQELAAAIDAGLQLDARERPRDIAAWLSMLRGKSLRSSCEQRRTRGRNDGGRQFAWRERRQTTYSLGRHPSCDVVLEDATVSGRHAELTWGRGGHVRITDQGSTNGTSVLKGRRWHPIQQALLGPADRVRFGNCEIVVSHLQGLCRGGNH